MISSPLRGNVTTARSSWPEASCCSSWTLKPSGDLLPFVPNKTGPYVMNCLLAHFVYARVFQFPAGTLRKQEERDHWILSNGSCTAAVGGPDQLDHLIEFLDRRVSLEKAQGAALLALEESLRTRFAKISGDLDFAIASRRLHKRCDLVSFF